ncbi:hypothetical protein D3C84_1312620 [compost metagenome]
MSVILEGVPYEPMVLRMCLRGDLMALTLSEQTKGLGVWSVQGNCRWILCGLLRIL